ncbi:MAG: hypothetical protein HC822_21545 [Oscillochloris sp.]|nr:hypothetical protein [Oscillochloris sp.]
MEAYGINLPLLLAQLSNIVLVILWIGLAIAALLRLNRLDMSTGVRLGWSALILCVPILGALALLITSRRST